MVESSGYSSAISFLMARTHIMIASAMKDLADMEI